MNVEGVGNRRATGRSIVGGEHGEHLLVLVGVRLERVGVEASLSSERKDRDAVQRHVVESQAGHDVVCGWLLLSRSGGGGV